MEASPLFYERLSALDAAFLAVEADGAHMHITSLALYGESFACRADGSVDIDALRSWVLGLVGHEPRLRQRLRTVPGLGHPYWIDDDHFRLDYHLRHTALPKPGDARQLRRLMGRLLSQPLSRGRPLWEMWIVEGLAEGGYAMILKLHHAMLDGMASTALLARMIQGGPASAPLPEPRPAPSPAQLFRIEARHRGRALVGRARQPRTRTDSAIDHPQQVIAGLRDLSASQLRRTLRTDLNPRHLSGQRKFDTLDVPFAELRQIKRVHQATINDAVLAIVAGGLRRFMLRTGVPEHALRTPFRALVPATTRAAGAKDDLGNEVGMMFADLPLHESDPVEQLRLIHQGQEFRKAESHQVEGSRLFVELDERLGIGLLGQAFKLVGTFRPFNVIVTNVPGPPVPVKVFGAPLKALYGAVPLTHGVGLGIALFSYAGTMHMGVQADLEALEEVHDFIEDLRAAHHALLARCTETSAQPRS